jgi:hypothetical protein
MVDTDLDGASDFVPAAPSTDILELRRAQRTRERLAARQCMVAMVDYLASESTSARPPTRIGEIAEHVLKRTGALAAARKFISTCEVDTVRDPAE